MDKDGKSPIQIAIKNEQNEAVKFAHEHNINRQKTLI